MNADFTRDSTTTMKSAHLTDNSTAFDVSYLDMNISGFFTDNPETNPGGPSFLVR